MTTNGKVTDAQLFQVWQANRPYLVNLAFGLLGDIGAAEDAVQEAFTRLASSAYDQIEDERGWLIVVTSRICLDQVRSARHRRERPHDASSLERTGQALPPARPVDPADRVTLDDEVRLALLVVLRRLQPAERVAFVLHDVFQTPFASIAETMHRSVPACRQLASRARTKVRAAAEPDRGAGSRAEVDLDPGVGVAAAPGDVAEHRLVTERFIEACANGDIAGLLPLLDPEVSGGVDLGPLDPRTGQQVRGAETAAGNLLRYFGRATLVSNPVANRSVVLAFVDRQLVGIILLTIAGSRVRKIHVVADQDQLGPLGAQLATG